LALLPAVMVLPLPSAEPAQKIPNGLVLEEQPTDPKQIKVVLVAGSNFFKAGEHEYVAGCGVLMDLLRQTPGVFPVLALDWPKKAETFAGARAVVFFFDGGDKHPFLKEDHLAQVQKLADGGVGLVCFHQAIDVPKDLGDRVRSWTGAAWEKGFSQRAHWVTEFKSFPEHSIGRGVKPFKIDDGWLYKLRIVPNLQGVTPLLSTVSPKAKSPQDASEAIVAWAYERAGKGRSFTFTGAHLHSSLAEEGYRRFLVQGILWSAGVEIPAAGAPVLLTPADLNRYLENRPVPKAK
jgi:type 1 glutamine amidotransferase